MRLILPVLLLAVFLATPAKAEEKACVNEVRLSIAKDVEHTTFLDHGYDVKKFAEEHPFGTRDFAQLLIDAGDGDWCVSFGTLRDFKYAISGITGVVVTIADQAVVSSTDVNDFQIVGLRAGQRVKIEITRLVLFPSDDCQRRESDGIFLIPRVGEERPLTTYECKGPQFTRWEVIEERVYVFGDADVTPKATP